MSSDPSGGLPIVQRTTAAGVGTVLLAAITAAGVSSVRSEIGAGTSNVALPGTGVAITLAGDAGTLDAAGAADGAVVSLVNGVPTYATVAASGPTLTTLRASDCVAESGSGTASITGSGAGSTFTLSTPANTSTTYSSSGATAPRILCAIPAGAARIDAEIGITATSWVSTTGARYLAAVLRSTGGGTPAYAWGVGWNDNLAQYSGNLTTGANAGSVVGTVPSNPAADRWMRAVWDTAAPAFGATFGTGSAGARPTVWNPSSQPAVSPSGNSAFLADTTGTASAVAVYLQTFGTPASTASVTATLTVRVLSL